MRRRILYLIALCLLLIAVGSIVAVREERARQRARATLAALPPIPDLSRWPTEFRGRVLNLTSAATRDQHPEQSLGELATLYLANDYSAEAEQTLRFLRKLDPQNPRWPYFLGTLRSRAGDKAQAERLFAETVNLAPEYPPALLHWGDSLALGAHFDEAQGLFERRLKLLPDDSAGLYALAKLDHARGNEDAAARRLRTVVNRDPKFQEAHLMLADLLEKKGDAPGAAEQRAFLRDGQPSPPTPDAWLDTAYLLSYDAYRLQVFGALRSQAGQNEAALPYLERASALDPGDIDIRGSLANTYISLGRLTDAEHTLEEGLKLAHDNELLEARVNQVLLKQGRGDEALHRIDHALSHSAENVVLLRAKGEILQQLNRPADAATAFQEALRLNPISMEVQLNLGRCLVLLGHREEGKTAVLRAHQMRPEEPEALGMLATLELEDRQLDQAERHVEQLYQRDPQRTQARELYALVKLRKANALAEAGMNAQAEAVYKDGLKVNPGYGPLQGGLGMLYGKLRRFADAQGCFERYLELSPSDPVGYILLGSAYASLGQRAEAQKTWSAGLAVAQRAKNEARSKQLEQLLHQ